MACGCCRCRCRHIKHFPAICCPPQRRCQLVAIRSQLAPCPALGRTLIIVIEFAKLRLKCFRPSLATWHPFIVWLFVCLFACLFASPPPPPLTVPFGNFTRCSSRFWTRFRFLIRFWFRFRFRVWAWALGLGLGLLARSPFAVCSLLDCLLIWRADAYQLPFLLAFRLRRSRLLSTKKIHCLLLRARPSKLLA